MYSILAEGVLVAHISYVAFILLGQIAIIIGAGFGWQWVRNPWFRCLHLLMIGIVCVEEAMGWSCPLTIWENSLRSMAGQTVADGSFVGRWLHRCLYIDDVWPAKAIQVLHVAFGVIVAQAFIMCPPRLRRTAGNVAPPSTVPNKVP